MSWKDKIGCAFVILFAVIVDLVFAACIVLAAWSLASGGKLWLD